MKKSNQIQTSQGEFNPEIFFTERCPHQYEMLFSEYEMLKEKLESPLEHVAFCRLLALNDVPLFAPRYFDILPQYEIKKWKTSYRVDFLIQPFFGVFKNIDRDLEQQRKLDGLSFIVEIDGFEHHSKMDKFVYEKQRHRSISMNKYPVFYFAGQEVWNMDDNFEVEIIAILEGQILKNFK